MKSNLLLLIKGEFSRLARYNIIQVGFGVSVLWLLVLFLIGRDNAAEFVPIFIFMDATMMTVLLIGAGLFYERQENTLKTLMVTPSKIGEIIFSKLLSAVYIAFQSALFIGIFAYFFFDATITFIIYIPIILLVAFAHAMIGYVFAVLFKDFTAMLGGLMLYMVLFAFPSLFYALGLLEGIFETLLLISPTHASMLLIQFGFGESITSRHLWVSVFYLLLLSVVLAKYVVFPKYMEKGIRE